MKKDLKVGDVFVEDVFGHKAYYKVEKVNSDGSYESRLLINYVPDTTVETMIEEIKENSEKKIEKAPAKAPAKKAPAKKPAPKKK